MNLGSTLKALREAKELSLGDVSARLKYSGRQIEALESEQWDSLPTGVSLRGLVRNYGRFLDANTDALLSMLDSQVGPTAAKPVAVSSPAAFGAADVSLQNDPVHRPWGWFIIILLLLLVAAFYAIERGWVPNSWLIFDWLKSLKK
ncbi:MAG: helix-turn-helix domain-containing protein [Candidimonas sp.]|nr:MAG: helix-turn-helix domain-containing protein [Candidimonas sp.]TAM22974.1 MAG: helix-turn-helix domain-containing protein [Candidimonas sp.]TAM77602.1 MAG: helix-turn-helix domain-containing protein [Candidimonas sp.]